MSSSVRNTSLTVCPLLCATTLHPILAPTQETSSPQGSNRSCAYLVPHVEQCAQHQPDCLPLVVGCKGPHILQQEISGPVEVAVREEGHYHAVLLHAPSSAVVPVHAAVSLAWWPPHDKFHLSGQRQVELVIWTQAYTEHTMAGSAAQHSAAEHSTPGYRTGQDGRCGMQN